MTRDLGLLGLKPMSSEAPTANESTATELNDFDADDECEECAKLSDGFPCADCYISGRKDFGEA